MAEHGWTDAADILARLLADVADENVDNEGTPYQLDGITIGASVPGPSADLSVFPPGEIHQLREIVSRYSKAVEGVSASAHTYMFRQLMRQTMNQTALLKQTSGRPAISDDNIYGAPIHVPYIPRLYFHNGFAPRGQSKTSRFLTVCGALCWEPGCASQIRRKPNLHQVGISAPSINPTVAENITIPVVSKQVMDELRLLRDNNTRIHRVGMSFSLYRQLLCQTCGKLNARYLRSQPASTHYHHSIIMDTVVAQGDIEQDATPPHIDVTMMTYTISINSLGEVLKDVKPSTWVALGFPKDHNPLNACFYPIRSGYRLTEAYQAVQPIMTTVSGRKKKVVTITPDMMLKIMHRSATTPMANSAGNPKVGAARAARNSATRVSRSRSTRQEKERKTRGATATSDRSGGAASHKFHDVARSIFESYQHGGVGATQTAFMPPFNTDTESIHPASVGIPASLVYGMVGMNAPITTPRHVRPDEWFGIMECEERTGKSVLLPYRILSSDGTELTFNRQRLVNGGLHLYDVGERGDEVFVWPDIQKTLATGVYGTVVIVSYLTDFSALELSRSPEMYELPGAYVVIIYDMYFKDIPRTGRVMTASSDHGLGVHVQTPIILLSTSGGDLDGDGPRYYIIDEGDFEQMQRSRHYLVRPGFGNVDLTINDMFGPISYLSGGALCVGNALRKIEREVSREKHGAPGWDTLIKPIARDETIYPWNPSSSIMLDPYNPLGDGILLRVGDPDSVLMNDSVLTSNWTADDRDSTKTCYPEATSVIPDDESRCLRPFVCHSSTDQQLMSDPDLQHEIKVWGKLKQAAIPSARIHAPTESFEHDHIMRDVVLKRCTGDCRSPPSVYPVTREEACVAAIFMRYGLMVYRRYHHPHDLGIQLDQWLQLLRFHAPVTNMVIHLRLLRRQGPVTSDAVSKYLKKYPLALPVVAFPCSASELQLAFKRVRAVQWNNHAPMWLYSHLLAVCNLSGLMLYQPEIPLCDDRQTKRAFIDEYRAAFIRDEFQKVVGMNFDHSKSHLQDRDINQAKSLLTKIMHLPPPSGKQLSALSLLVGMPEYTEVTNKFTTHKSQSQRSAFLTSFPSDTVVGHADRRDVDGISESELNFIGRIGAYWQTLLIVTSSYYITSNGVTTPIVSLGDNPDLAIKPIPSNSAAIPSRVDGGDDEIGAQWSIELQNDNSDQIASQLGSPAIPEEVDAVDDDDIFADDFSQLNFGSNADDSFELSLDLPSSPSDDDLFAASQSIDVESKMSDDLPSDQPDGAYVVDVEFPMKALIGTNEKKSAEKFTEAARNQELITISPFESPVHRCYLMSTSPDVAKASFSMHFHASVWGQKTGTTIDWLNSVKRPGFCGCRTVFRGTWKFVSIPRVSLIPISPGVQNGKWGGPTSYGSASWREPIVGTESFTAGSFVDVLDSDDAKLNLSQLEHTLKERMAQFNLEQRGLVHVWTPPIILEELLCGMSIEKWMQWLMPHKVIADIIEQAHKPPSLEIQDRDQTEIIALFRISVPSTHFQHVGTTDTGDIEMTEREFRAPINGLKNSLMWVKGVLVDVLRAYRHYVGQVCFTHIILPPLWGHIASLSCVDDVHGDSVVDLFKEITELFQAVLDNDVWPSAESTHKRCLISGHGVCNIHDPVLVAASHIGDVFPIDSVASLQTSCIGDDHIRTIANKWKQENEAFISVVLEQKFDLDNLVVLPLLKCLSSQHLIRTWMYAHADAFWLEPVEFKLWFEDGIQRLLNKDDTAGRFHPYKSLVAFGHNNSLQHVLDLIKKASGNLGLTPNEAERMKLSPQTLPFPYGTVLRVINDQYTHENHDNIFDALDQLWEDPNCSTVDNTVRASRLFVPIEFSSAHRPLVADSAYGSTRRKIAGFEFKPANLLQLQELKRRYIDYCSYVFAASPVSRHATPTFIRGAHDMSVVVVNDMAVGRGVHSPTFSCRYSYTEIQITSNSKENFKGRDIATIVIPDIPDRLIIIVIPAVSKLNRVDQRQIGARNPDVSRILITNDNPIFRPDTWKVNLQIPDLVSVSGDFDRKTFTVTLPKSRSVTLTMIRAHETLLATGTSIFPWYMSLCWDILGCGGVAHAREQLVGKFVGKSWPSIVDGVTTAFLGRKGMVPNATEKSLSADVVVQGFVRNQGNRSLYQPMFFDKSTLVGKIILGGTEGDHVDLTCPAGLRRDKQIEENPFPLM